MVPDPARPLDGELRAVLDLERAWGAAPRGSKERLIREVLSMTPNRYAAALQRALDHPAAVAYDAPTVRRLVRRRERGRGRLRGSGPRGLE